MFVLEALGCMLCIRDDSAFILKARILLFCVFLTVPFLETPMGFATVSLGIVGM